MKQTLVIALTITIILLCAACGGDSPEPVAGNDAGKVSAKARRHGIMKKETKKTVDFIADIYVRLCFQVGRFDADYVDAYFGPDALKKAALAKESEKSLEQIKKSADILIFQLKKIPLQDATEMFRRRVRNLTRMLQSMTARVDFLAGKKMTFDEESQALYGAVSPIFPAGHYDDILKQLETLLPGSGTLGDRIDAFRRKFVIPREKLDAVFQTAIAEGRKRSKTHIALLENETFDLEYVTGKSWGAYNWFKGGGRSLIQVNTDLPIYIDRAIDLACHEGYPGHHVYYSLIEQKLYKEKGWLETCIYPLFSPLSLLAEGTANYGIAVAFPGKERIKYEKEILCPLAGLDGSDLDKYYDVMRLTGKLSFAGNDTARRFLDGKINADEAVAEFVKYRLMNKDRAEKYLSFVNKYRSYVINYNLGLQMVRGYIEKRGGTDNQPEKRWQEFKKLMSAPILPEDLQ